LYSNVHVHDNSAGDDDGDGDDDDVIGTDGVTNLTYLLLCVIQTYVYFRHALQVSCMHPFRFLNYKPKRGNTC